MPSNNFCNRWQNERALTNCYMIEMSHPQMIKKYEEQDRYASIGKHTNSKLIDKDNTVFSKTSDDKLLEVKTPKERKQEIRDNLDSCCQTPIDWKELTKYDINNLLQYTSTEK